MAHDTRPATLNDAAGPDPWQPFRVEHPAEVLALLRRLVDGAVPLNLAGPDGSAVTCTLWSLDPAAQRIAFSADGVHPLMQRLVEADEAVAVAYLDHVKLQFDLCDLILVHGAHGSALQAGLPQQLYRFQRRQSFRVRTLERHAPCARFAHPADGHALALRIIDISDGGCALFLPDDELPPAPGSRLAPVHVELDAETRFDATLLLQHVTSIQPNARGVRLGCELLELKGHAPRLLQRYIDRTQKQRRLLQLD